MSGHSKWSQIKHKKAATDKKKGQLYSKLSRYITLAAREKGSDPETNPVLRLAISKAKEINMPSDNIERAIKRGSSADKEALIEFLIEAYGPGGVAIMVTGITDSVNRTTQEIKHVLSDHGAKMAGPGSAKFLFNKTEDGWEAKSDTAVSEADEGSLLKLFEALDNNDDIQEVYSNADLQDK